MHGNLLKVDQFIAFALVNNICIHFNRGEILNLCRALEGETPPIALACTGCSKEASTIVPGRILNLIRRSI